MKIFAADYVLPISAEPISNGAIAFDETKIAVVGAREEIAAQFPETEIENFGEAVILPGLINCHSHLEITAMRGFLDDVEADFFSWLMKLTKTRGEHLTDEDIKIAALAGALEGVRAGVTCFGDIGRFGVAGFEALKTNGLRGVLFQETEFSPINETASEEFEKLKDKFLQLKATETNLVKVGISPHSPYTVSAKLFEKITDYALAENVEISIHAAESNDETNFFQTGKGFFGDLYKNRNIEWNAPQISPVEYLSNIGALNSKPLLAHCVKVSGADIEILAASDSCIAHCPKSNAKFGHGIAPFEKFLDAKVTIGFGSDSVASNNACDIFEEARFAALFARSHQDKRQFLDAKTVIKTATLGAAKAIKLENEIGSLESGKQADLIVVALDNLAQMPIHDVYAALLFATTARDVKLTVVAGREIYRDSIANLVDEREIKIKMREIAEKMAR